MVRLILAVTPAHRKYRGLKNLSEQIDLSIVESEVFLELGVPRGQEYFNYPQISSVKERMITFLDHPLTEIILKRPETTSFPLIAHFSEKELSGDPLCIDTNGNTMIAQDGHILRFNFNPFHIHLSNITEGFMHTRSSYTKYLLLVLYFRSPRILRDVLRSFARKTKNLSIRSVRDLHVIAQSSNIIIKLFEDHLSSIGVIEDESSTFSSVLTHDIDIDFCQTEGFLATNSLEIDEGVDSTWFFVPESNVYTLNKKTIQELVSQGNEIGLHGLTHSGSLDLRNPEILRRQIRKGRSLLNELGSEVVSFRSPFMLRSPVLLSVLAQEGFVVDSSYPDIDTLGLTGGLPGVRYNRPFRPIIMKPNATPFILNLWEIPSSTPQDVQLFEDLGLDDDQVTEIWKYKADFCKDYGGVFVHHSHPWFIAKRPEPYVQVIKHLKKQGAEICQMREIGEKRKRAISINA